MNKDKLFEQALDELARMERALTKIWGLSGNIVTLHSSGDDTVIVRRERITGIFDLSCNEHAVRGEDLRAAMVRRSDEVRRSSEGSGCPHSGG